jgi:hypothetical protein
MYDEEEEITSTKIQIPKNKILYSDIELEKRELYNSSENMLSLAEKSDRSERNIKKEEKSLIEKILECIFSFILLCIRCRFIFG